MTNYSKVFNKNQKKFYKYGISDSNSDNNVIENNKKFVEIYKNANVKIIKQNDIADIVYCWKKTQPNCKKISKSEYVVTSGENAGVVKKYKKHNRKNSESLKKSAKRLSQLINTNFTGYRKNELMITLTYQENMQDVCQLRKDWDNFLKRLKRRIDFDFAGVKVAEPQERGAWHLHILIKRLDDKNFYIKNDWLRSVWKHGFVQVERVKNNDIGSYLASYLTDFKGKKYNRLDRYPSNFKFYSTFGKLKKPKVEYIKYKDVITRYKYLVSRKIVDVEINNEVRNTIIIERWNARQVEKNKTSECRFKVIVNQEKEKIIKFNEPKYEPMIKNKKYKPKYRYKKSENVGQYLLF